MLKKRILVCDDEKQQRDTLRARLEDRYEVIEIDHHEKLIDAIKANSPIHLVILDLMFNGNLEGQTALPRLQQEFPHIKVLIYSTLLDGTDEPQELTKLLTEINFSQITGFASPIDYKGRLLFHVNQATGSSEWIKNNQVWILHMSDIQFGGRGGNNGPEVLARKIWDCMSAYKREHSQVSPDEENYFDLPDMAVITGDITEHARPKQYEEATEFINSISDLIERENNIVSGLFNRKNVLFIPGNHDVNWDISRARSIENKKIKKKVKGKETEVIETLYSKEKIITDLDYLRDYAWLPYDKFAREYDQDKWHYGSGYQIYDMSRELHLIFVCLNSSLWEINHLTYNPVVPEEVFSHIRRELETKDPNYKATRILLTHHTMEHSAEAKNRLKIKQSPDDPNLIRTLSADCRFSLILSGHIHQQAVAKLNTKHKNRTLYNIGAGTLRSADRGEYVPPQFNLIRLWQLSLESNKFEKVSIYPFAYDGNIFKIDPQQNDGNIDYQLEDIKYMR